MKQSLLLAIVLLLAAPQALSQQPSIEGYWEGAAVREGAVRVIRLDIFKDGANLRCRVELPDFLNFAFPPLPVQQDGDKLTLRLPMTGEYLLTHDAKLGEMRGAFSGQQALPVTIHLKRAIKAADFDWLRRNDCDPVPHLKKIKAPWLAFYGTRDYIVPPTENTKKLEQYLTEAGNKDCKIVVLENADHSMALPNTNRRESAEANAKAQFIWGRVPPELTQTMLDWLLARVTVAQKR